MFAHRGRLDPTRTSAFVLIHAGAAFAVWWGFTRGFSGGAWACFAGMWALAATGISVGYHRRLTHSAFQCSSWFEKVLYWFAAMAVEGNGEIWGKTHSQHHAFADRAGDPHRPSEYSRWWEGLLWAHCGWIFFRNIQPEPDSAWKPSPRFSQDAAIQWQRRWYVPLAASGFVIPFLLAGWNGLLLAGFLRVVLCWHVTWGTNSICHMFGDHAHSLADPDRVLETRAARNFPLQCLFNVMAVVSWGEFWHANHHAKQNSAFLGWRWFEFDPGAWVILAAQKMGLVWDVKAPLAAKPA